jgi:hypothetical protein
MAHAGAFESLTYSSRGVHSLVERAPRISKVGLVEGAAVSLELQNPGDGHARDSGFYVKQVFPVLERAVLNQSYHPGRHPIWSIKLNQ